MWREGLVLGDVGITLLNENALDNMDPHVEKFPLMHCRTYYNAATPPKGEGIPNGNESINDIV